MRMAIVEGGQSMTRLWRSFFIVVAHAATAMVHLWWPDLPETAVSLVRICLASPSVGVFEGIARLHVLVLVSFAVAVSFRVTSAHQLQVALRQHRTTLTFDDIKTAQGWADVPCNYSFLDFTDFYILNPSAPELRDRISKHDLNCAASMPNALYAARPLPLHRLPTMQLNSSLTEGENGPRSFTLHSLKIKPLDMPLGSAKVSMRGVRHDNNTLLWDVDFPAGFHERLAVDIASFSGKTWDKLEKVEMSADFHYEGTTLDWEFCLDDVEISFAE